MGTSFSPAFYIPLWFNIILFWSGLVLLITSIYFLLKNAYPWFVNLPMAAYSLHFSVFYGFITFAQLTSHLLDNSIMTLWSAILRFQGITTAVSMMIILYLSLGEEFYARKRKS